MQQNDGSFRHVLDRLDKAFKVQVDRLGVVVGVGNGVQAHVADDRVVVG